MINSFKESIQKNWLAAGFEKPTKVQERTIPLILEGKDVLAEAPTGSGKTLAYLLPALQKIQEDTDLLQCVIVGPTRELVMQIHQEIQKFTKDTGIRSGAFIGGVEIKRHYERLKKKPHIVVGTPGRLVELINARRLKMHEVKLIVLDEFDQLVNQHDLDNVLRIVKGTMKDRQLLFFSATISSEIQEVATNLTDEIESVRIEGNKNNVEHGFIVCDFRDKLEYIRRIANISDVKAMVFMNDAFRLNENAEKLRFRGLKVGVIHSDMGKQDRANTLRKFRNGEINLVLTTDIGARGLDIEGLTHVIQLDVPESKEQYVHRSGRTGRMGKKGAVVNLVTVGEEKKLSSILRKLTIPSIRIDVMEGQIVHHEDKVEYQKQVKNKKPLKRVDTNKKGYKKPRN